MTSDGSDRWEFSNPIAGPVLAQVVTRGGSVDGRLAAYIVSYVVVTNWVVLQVVTSLLRFNGRGALQRSCND